jgi:hypothetical protein
MTNITMHLTANFYPPIPADIQLRVQEIFDELQRDSDPFISGWADIPEDWCYEYEDWSVFDRKYELPNGAVVTGRSLCDDLRLWDALFWECDEPMDTWEDHEREAIELANQVPGQLSFWTVE